MKTNSPLFPSQDGIIYDDVCGDVGKNNLGYDYYPRQPGSLLKSGLQKWRKLLANQTKK
ncbi:MAG: hypothetical protein QM813_03630 [Verrucomicrobiota bacterium]